MAINRSVNVLINQKTTFLIEQFKHVKFQCDNKSNKYLTNLIKQNKEKLLRTQEGSPFITRQIKHCVYGCLYKTLLKLKFHPPELKKTEFNTAVTYKHLTLLTSFNW